MKSYGQFCSIARALDLLGERWTLLIVRELLSGSRRFGEVQRGIPLISRTMLSSRFRQLADAGVIARHQDSGAGPEYRLTPAGLELAAVVRDLGTWGQRWLLRELQPSELDPRPVLGDFHRRVRRAALPERPLVGRIEQPDLGRSSHNYLLLRRAEASLCDFNPGFLEELHVRADRRTLIGWWRGSPNADRWWRGDLTLRQAIAAGIVLDARREKDPAPPTRVPRAS